MSIVLWQFLKFFVRIIIIIQNNGNNHFAVIFVRSGGVMCRKFLNGIFVFAVICVCTIIFSSSVLERDDITPPCIRLKNGDCIKSLIGEGISFLPFLDIIDNVTPYEKIKVKVDSSDVDIYKVGVYYATVTAMDNSGNLSSEVIKVFIYSEDITNEELIELIRHDVLEILDECATKEEICRKIYSFVKEKIRYGKSINTDDYLQSAYYGMIYGIGDCFTSCSLARSFLDCFNIEYKTVKRSDGYTSDTHYWLLVNVGDEGSDAWYHLDCTRLKYQPYLMGCLMTDAQLERYCNYRYSYTGQNSDLYFYRYEKELFPNTETKVITAVYMEEQ